MKENQRRHDMSEICHPNKINLDDFAEEIMDAIPGFVKNIKHLQENPLYLPNSLYIEQWFEIFARWSEIQSEGFDPFITEERSDS